MIHDPIFSVTCDSPNCDQEDFLEGHRTIAGYDCIDDDVERFGWIVEDGKHYCCKHCFDHKNDEIEDNEIPFF